MAVTSPTRKRVPRAEREPEMLDVAVRAFAQNGYHGVSMEEIAQSAGVTKPMVYAYFDSKDGLYLACIEHAGRRLMEALAAAAAEESDPEQVLWLRLLAFFRFVDDHRAEWQVLRREAASGGGPASERLLLTRERMVELVQAQLHEAIEAHSLPTLEGDLEPLAHALVGAGESLAEWWVDHPGEPAEEMALRLMNLVWLGLERLVSGQDWAPSPPGSG